MGIDFKYIIKNLNQNKYRLIGSGSGRHVYDLDNGYVVKVAKNKRGFVQNKAEYQIASSNHSPVFAKIVAVSDDFECLIMEKADRIMSFSVIFQYYHVRNYRELFRLDEFKDFPKKYNLLFADLRRRSSWGLVKGKPVIIDFGFTREVSRYYTLFR